MSEKQQKNKQKNLGKCCLELFLTFAKIGTFTFGGGYAMISLIQAEIADHKKWVSKEDVLDMVAIAESTPGPIAINSATFVGYKRAGIIGSVCATLGVVIPSFLIISIISLFIREFKELQAVQYAFEGIRVGVVVLVIKAFISMWKGCKKNWFFYTMCGLAFLAVAFLNLSPILMIVLAAVTGIILAYAGVLQIEEKEEK